MLELCVNQGAGLQGIAPQAGPRMLAMASHGDHAAELPLLWQLCATLVELDYPVAVLDAGATESALNPGLLQLLEDGVWRDGERQPAPSCAVIPAALGLSQLCCPPAGAGPALDALGELFQDFGVIIVYARAEVLTSLLAHSGIEPLLGVSPHKMSCVRAYQSLKQLLLNAQLRPTIASLVGESDANPDAASFAPLRNLRDCAMTFLDYPLHLLSVRARESQEGTSDDMHRLALRLLERAMPLARHSFFGSH